MVVSDSYDFGQLANSLKRTSNFTIASWGEKRGLGHKIGRSSEKIGLGTIEYPFVLPEMQRVFEKEKKCRKEFLRVKNSSRRAQIFTTAKKLFV